MKVRSVSGKVVTHPRRSDRRIRALRMVEQRVTDYENGNWSMFTPTYCNKKYGTAKLSKTVKKEKLATAEQEVKNLRAKLGILPDEAS